MAFLYEARGNGRRHCDGDAATAYHAAMNLFGILAAIAMLAVLTVLLAGVVVMARGGEFNRRWGNVLMRWRVLLQLVAIVLIVLAFLFSGR